ncbi:putative protein [Geobacter sp. OR-1]|uniref:hypothetical protein n=1 Tax=Geobacter sp. OR-1 TaxID=1266765 RepID=UPI000542444A|nr:hypothetical protein [Geobacter sp. OR-1]GAM09074.1 putative protein [Geobacter sp. OR-1]
MGNLGCGCPGSMARVIERETTEETNGFRAASELRQWPVQLHLVPPTAPYFKEAEILVCADCVAFAMGSMHQELLKGKALAIACPKLDDTAPYVEKLANIFRTNNTPKITVAIMEVPCCRGLDMMVREAVHQSGREIPLELVVIGIDGNRRN